MHDLHPLLIFFRYTELPENLRAALHDTAGAIGLRTDRNGNLNALSVKWLHFVLSKSLSETPDGRKLLNSGFSLKRVHESRLALKIIFTPLGPP